MFSVPSGVESHAGRMTTRALRVSSALAVMAVVCLSACGSDDDSTSGGANAPGDTSPHESATSPSEGTTTGGSSADGNPQPRVPKTPLASVDPADFVEGVDNPYLPLNPGTRWV